MTADDPPQKSNVIAIKTIKAQRSALSKHMEELRAFRQKTGEGKPVSDSSDDEMPQERGSSEHADE